MTLFIGTAIHDSSKVAILTNVVVFGNGLLIITLVHDVCLVVGFALLNEESMVIEELYDPDVLCEAHLLLRNLLDCLLDLIALVLCIWIYFTGAADMTCDKLVSDL